MTTMMNREYLCRLKHDAILTGNLHEVARINKIARFNGVSLKA